jgi:hypothetical protein
MRTVMQAKKRFARGRRYARPPTVCYATVDDDGDAPAADDELAKLRKEIKELEDSLEADKRKNPPVAVKEPHKEPPKRTPRRQGGPAIKDGKVQVEVVLSKLDATQLPDGIDVESEKEKFAQVLNLDKMAGEGLKHTDVMQAWVVTLDANEDLVALLEGVQVDLEDAVDLNQFKDATDKFVKALSDVFATSDGTEWSEDDWQKVAEAVDDGTPERDDSLGELFDAEDDLIFGIDVRQPLTPEVLGFRVNERFYASLNDHWRDWCAVASERSGLGGLAPPENELAAFGAAVEKRAGMAQLEAVSTRDFANDLNATQVDKSLAIDGTPLYERAFRQKLKVVSAKGANDRTREELDELWVLLRCATRRGSQSAAFVEQLAGYFFQQVTESDARDVVLDKLRDFDLIPKDEFDPQKLREAFIVKVARYVDFFAGAINVLSAVAFVGFNYLLWVFLVQPLVDWLFGNGGAEQIPDFFADK